ncbi:MAG: alpha/beta hydrolase [Methanobacterium sp. ERen5]|nr:MAG: alpha/beta hydrolase [Methanobacterium sp. ERen5]
MYANVNGIKMYYEIFGEGKPLMILWGMGGEIGSFVDKIKEIKKYKLITFDNRGTGRTDKPNEEYTIEIMAEDAISLLDELKIQRVNILGISMGSRIAITMAAKYPDRVSNLILNVAAAKSVQNSDENSMEAYEKLKEVANNPELLNAMGKYPPTSTSFLRLFDALASYDGTKYLKEIKSPTLIVNGTQDSSTPVTYAEELVDHIPNSKLILVKENHFFIRTKPELLIVPMDKFLSNKMDSID